MRLVTDRVVDLVGDETKHTAYFEEQCEASHQVGTELLPLRHDLANKQRHFRHERCIQAHAGGVD